MQPYAAQYNYPAPPAPPQQQQQQQQAPQHQTYYGHSAGDFGQGGSYPSQQQQGLYPQAPPPGQGPYDQAFNTPSYSTSYIRPQSGSYDMASQYAGSPGIVAYDGGTAAPLGAFGTGLDGLDRSTRSSTPSRNDTVGGVERGPGGVQRFRCRLHGDSVQTVLCQIGMDGVRFLDTSGDRTLRIYPLQTVTRWEMVDAGMFAFYAKSSVDSDARPVKLSSDRSTLHELQDTLAANCIQLSEMLGKDASSTSHGTKTASSSSGASTKGAMFVEWIAARKREGNNPLAMLEERQHWVPDEVVKQCTACQAPFTALRRKHHCRSCGDIFCDACTRGRVEVSADNGVNTLVRICDSCQAEIAAVGGIVSGGSATTATSTPPASSGPDLSSLRHEDLVKKLQDDYERNAAASRSKPDNSVSVSGFGGHSSQPAAASYTRTNSAPMSHSSPHTYHGPPHLWPSVPPMQYTPSPVPAAPRMQEVLCPTCHVRLQVQVPPPGQDSTVECGVCHNPFFVAAG
eukprot:jgi/Chlat1/2756/Chrsp187S02938